MFSGDDLERMLEGTMQSKLTCPTCGATFSFEEGVAKARSQGITLKVVACVKCNTVHLVNVTQFGVSIGKKTAPAGDEKDQRATRKRQAHDMATKWWAFTGRTAANCDKCETRIEQWEGYFISPTAIICEECADKSGNILPYTSEITIPPNAIQSMHIEAPSMEEAQALIESVRAKNCYVVSQKIVSDGNTITLRSYGDTFETAFSSGTKQIPETAEILSKTEKTTPEHKEIKLSALDEQELGGMIMQKFGNSAQIEKIQIDVAGAKGFLGIGKKPNWYKVSYFIPAMVEIRYKSHASIDLQFIGPKVAS